MGKPRPEYQLKAEKKYAKTHKVIGLNVNMKDYQLYKEIADSYKMTISELIKISLDEYLENHHL